MLLWHNRVFPRMEAKMFERLKTWWRAEGDLVKVAGLNDRLLKDIGLDRGELRELVHGRSDRPAEEDDCYRHPLKRVWTREGTV